MGSFPQKPSVLFVESHGWLDEAYGVLEQAFADLGFTCSRVKTTDLRNQPSPDEYKSHLDGIDLEELCKPSVARIQGERRGSMIKRLLSKDEERLRRQVQSDFVQAFCATMHVLKNERPSVIVIENGYVHHARAAAIAARRLGVQVIALENSFLKDRFYLEHRTTWTGNRISIAGHGWDLARSKRFDHEMASQVRNYLDRHMGLGSRDGMIKHPKPIPERKALLEKLGLDGSAEFGLLLCQVAHDSVVVADSHPFFGMMDLVTSVVQALPDRSELVIRFHPKESVEGGDDTYKRFKEYVSAMPAAQRRDIESRVALVKGNEVNTYSLMEIASFGITLNSQAGLEMLCKGKPVVVCGTAFYANKGFTVDVSTRDMLGPALNAARQKRRLTTEETGTLNRFLYHLVFEQMCPYKLEDVKHRLRRVIVDWWGERQYDD